VTNPALTGTAPTAPSSSRFAWLNRYIPFILVLFVVVVVALVALITMRPSKKPSGGS
jgi:hypothetical protein